MTYFTILHWFAIAIILTLFCLILVLTIRNNDEKSLVAPIVTYTFVAGIMTFFAIYGLDKYTKIARLENIVQKKILINESFSISGQIRNIGDFKIGKCTLEVKISNHSLENASIDGAIFLPKSALENFFKHDTENIVDTTKKFVIAENLHKGEMRNFTVFMRYPPSFVKPSTRYELYCH